MSPMRTRISESKDASRAVKNSWRSKKARDIVNGLRRRLHSLGHVSVLTEAADPISVAKSYLDCSTCFLDDLTDRMALEYLAAKWGLNIDKEEPNDDPLAGGLYVTAAGDHRWIFVKNGDPLQRQRWTVAHEIGHLVGEVLPHLQRREAFHGDLFGADIAPRLLRFGRCTLANNGPLTRAGKLELDANDFAAEFLMPLDGMRQMLAERHPHGIRSHNEVADLINKVRKLYDVSQDAANRRVTIDMDIQPIGSRPTKDLF